MLEPVKHKGTELTEESTPLYKAQTSPFGRRVLALNFPVKGTREINEQGERGEEVSPRQSLSVALFSLCVCSLFFSLQPGLPKSLLLTISSPFGVSSFSGAVTFYLSLKSNCGVKHPSCGSIASTKGKTST